MRSKSGINATAYQQQTYRRSSMTAGSSFDVSLALLRQANSVNVALNPYRGALE
jgi:hypothetical protein